LVANRCSTTTQLHCNTLQHATTTQTYEVLELS